MNLVALFQGNLVPFRLTQWKPRRRFRLNTSIWSLVNPILIALWKMQPKLRSGLMQSVCTAGCSQYIMSEINVLYFEENKGAGEKLREEAFWEYLERKDNSIQASSMQCSQTFPPKQFHPLQTFIHFIPTWVRDFHCIWHVLLMTLSGVCFEFQ